MTIVSIVYIGMHVIYSMGGEPVLNIQHKAFSEREKMQVFYTELKKDPIVQRTECFQVVLYDGILHHMDKTACTQKE